MSRKYHVQKTDPYGKIYTVSYRSADDYYRGEGNYPTHFSSNTSIPSGLGCLPLGIIGLIFLCVLTSLPKDNSPKLTDDQHIARVKNGYIKLIKNLKIAYSKCPSTCGELKHRVSKYSDEYKWVQTFDRQGLINSDIPPDRTVDELLQNRHY
jgi:hypothetical protein